MAEKKFVKAIILDSGRTVMEDELKKYAIPESKQLIPEDQFKGVDCLQPPFDLTRMMAWLMTNVTHSSCVHTKVQDSVGVGWSLHKVQDDASEETKLYLEKFLSKVNESEGITQVARKVMLDYEGCGNGYIEVVRDMANKVSKLYHVNATTIRVRNDRETYIQMVGLKKVYFKKFGDDRILNNKTGAFVKESKPEDIANEIIHLKFYTYLSHYYGLPEWLPSIYSMYGEMKQQEYNLEFFSNFGVPAYSVIIEGGDLSPDTQDEIKKFFETELKKNPHKTLMLSTPEGVTLRFEKLSVEQKEASFRIYRRDNRDDVLTAHHVPPYRASIVTGGALGGNVASETDRMYLESVINPRQEGFEWIMNQLIFLEGFEVTSWAFVFDDIRIDDKVQQSSIDQAYFNIGVMSPNEIRVAMGLEGYEGGDVYVMNAGLLPIGGKSMGDITPQVQPILTTDEPLVTEEQMLPEEKFYYKVAQLSHSRIVYKSRIEVYQEFQRQKRQLIKFMDTNDVFDKWDAYCKEKYPDNFSAKEEKVFNKISPEDYKYLEQLMEGWEKNVKPEKMAEVLHFWELRAGKLGGQEALKSLGVKMSFNLRDPNLIKRLMLRGTMITGDITNKTITDFRKIMIDEYTQGNLSPYALKREIRDMFEDTYRDRAFTIARTETGIAISESSHETYKKNNVSRKRWLAMVDDRTRESHVALDGQIRKVDEPFETQDGVEIMFPLDPSAPAEEVINCRCREVPIVTEEITEESAWTGG